VSDPRLGRRRTGHAVTRTAEVLSVLTPVEDQDLQLLAEVGPCDAVQEEVDAVVHVEDDARNHQHAFALPKRAYTDMTGDCLRVESDKVLLLSCLWLRYSVVLGLYKLNQSRSN